MTLSALQKAVYRRVKLPDSPSTADVNRILDFLNQRYRKLMGEPGMDQFRDTTLTFATVSAQKFYGLPAALVAERDLYDLTNQRRILPRTVDWLRNVDPGLTATSSFTEFWIPFPGWGAQIVQPAQTGVGLWVVSDNAGDTTQKAYVETVRLNGIPSRLAVSGGTSLNGLTRVQIGSQTDHVQIVKFYLDSAPAGNVSIYDAASNGNLITTINLGRTNARYYMIQLYPTPGAAVTLSVDCRMNLLDLVNPNEEPLFPEDFHLALVHGALYDEFDNRDDSRKDKHLAEYNQLVARLRHFVQTTEDSIPVQRGPRGNYQRVSRLGGYFPAGTAFLLCAIKLFALGHFLLWS